MRRVVSAFWTAGLAGLLVGAGTAVVEVMVFLHSPTGAADRFLLPAIRFYACLWVSVAVLLGLIRAFFWRARPAEMLRWHLSVLIPLALFLVGGGYINLWFLPELTDPKSLAVDGIYAALNLLLGLWLYRRGLARLWKPALTFFGVALAAALALSLSSKQREEPAQAPPPTGVSAPPNVLLITVDAMRPDHMSAYGYSRDTTPNIRQLAQEGILFRQAFANSCWTRASVASMFTSLYPSSHGVNDIGSGLPASLTTLPETMKAGGYATGIFSANAFVSPVFGYGQGVDRFYYKEVSIFNELILGHMFRPLRKYHPLLAKLYAQMEQGTFPFGRKADPKAQAPRVNAAFLEWVRGLNGRPFFAYFHYMEAHTPYSLPALYQQKFLGTGHGPVETREPLNESFRPFAKAEPLPPDRYENLVSQYDGGIAYVDAGLGELFRQMKGMGLYDRTVILITADHGEEFYDHEGWGHGKSLFEELIHVPLVARGPGFPAGQVREEVVRHLDLLPTIVEIGGGQVPSAAAGTSWLARARDPKISSEPLPVYTEVYHGSSEAQAVRAEGFKLIRVKVQSKQARMLFDLTSDPKERSPIDPDQHPMGPRLSRMLESFQSQARRRAVRPERVEVDQGTRDRLRSLGYVQ